MIPKFQADGNLPPGIHGANWPEVARLFGTDDHRKRLLTGLHAALLKLHEAGCTCAYLDGSFATLKPDPNDFDVAWDLAGVDLAALMRLEPLMFEFANRRAAQKAKYYGELFPASFEAAAGKTFLDFFQIDKESGDPKGIVAIDLRTL